MAAILLVFIFGLIIGSFLNCAIYRMYKEESFVGGRSYCPRCKHELAAHDLLPLFSFIFLKGKCRYCKAPISWQYPIVELATSLLFVFSYLKFFPYFPEIIFWWIMFSFFVVIFVFDYEYYLIPDEVTYSAIGFSVLWIIFSYFSRTIDRTAVMLSALSAVGSAAFFFLLWFFSKGKAMGFGDVKLAFLIGLLMGFPNVIAGLFLSFLLGAIIGLALMVLKKKGMKSEIPFGPFLITGTFLAVFYGGKIINWYLSFRL
jgi:leader peptidase (prepilin peptidase) / N-methyltransferase